VSYLDLAWVKHDSNWGTERLGWEISGEFGLDRTAITVMAGDLTPNGSVLGIRLQRFSSVDISHSLAQVEFSVLLSADSLNLENGVVGSLITLSFGVASHNSSSVQTARLTCSVNTS